MNYTPHPSERLKAHFRKKPWQGTDPLEACFLFVGLDANYDANIETTLPEVFDYLNDSELFWREKKVHHPFRLPHYNGSGKRYHDRFAEIGFSFKHARQLSFIELLNIPTVGRSALTIDDLSPDHLELLNHILYEGSARYIFIPSGVARLMRRSGHFRWLAAAPTGIDGDLPILHESHGRIFYQPYHFSCYGWQLSLLKKQIAQIRDIWGNRCQSVNGLSGAL